MSDSSENAAAAFAHFFPEYQPFLSIVRTRKTQPAGSRPAVASRIRQNWTAASWRAHVLQFDGSARHSALFRWTEQALQRHELHRYGIRV
jgi:hypothetical protein